jgi:lysophospholipid acyltransferase (LPLAT)-like uncharacterized protein
MAGFKSLMRRPGPRAAACWLGARYIRLVRLTGRWRIEGAEHPERLLAENRPFLVAFWHGRLLMMSEAWPYDTPFQMVISQHADGALISKTIENLGFGTLSGSTSKGGVAVLRAMVRALGQGSCVGITPDGPRGPRMRAAQGAVQAARLAGVPILPIAYTVRPSRTARSWDSMMIPSLFGRGIIRWGPPMEIARDADLKDATQDLEARLNELVATLDQELGLPPVEPAPQPAPAQMAGERFEGHC